MRPLAWCLLLGGAIAAQASAQQANYYRWKDAQGVTHYSETPPPDGKAQRVTLQGGVSSAEADDAPAPVDPGKLDKADAAAHARNCENAKDNLKMLDGNGLLVDSSDPDKAKRMSPDEVAAAKRQATQDVATYCGKSP